YRLFAEAARRLPLAGGTQGISLHKGAIGGDTSIANFLTDTAHRLGRLSRLLGVTEMNKAHGDVEIRHAEPITLGGSFERRYGPPRQLRGVARAALSPSVERLLRQYFAYRHNIANQLGRS